MDKSEINKLQMEIADCFDPRIDCKLAHQKLHALCDMALRAVPEMAKDAEQAQWYRWLEKCGRTRSLGLSTRTIRMAQVQAN